MFEHLGPTPEVSINKQSTNYKLYLSLLVLSTFVFMFSMGVSRGPSSQAQRPYDLFAEIFVDSSDKKIVSTAKNFSIFDFVIDVNHSDTSLYKLNILVEGIYDLSLIRDLKLFHGDVQLGEINKIDNDGKLYFDLAEYKLNEGKNKFSLFFNNGDSLKDGQILKFSIPDRKDIFLINNKNVFRPQVDFPIEGGFVSILDRGKVMASNGDRVNDFLIKAGVPQQIAAFELSSIGEKLDLHQIKISYQNLSSDDEQEDLAFALIYDNQLISEAISSDEEIVFELSQNIVLQDTSRERFYLYAISMPEDVYQFFVSDIAARGVVSGLDISLLDDTTLNKVEARSYFVQFNTSDLDRKLSEGWNKIYSLKIKTIGVGTAYLNKVSFAIDKQNLDIDTIEVYRNGEPYITNIVLKDNKLIIKTDGLEPLIVGSKPTELSILANLINIKPKAKIEVYVLADEELTDEELISGNIIWSDGVNFYNGYKMPYLPLEPSILSN